ncbi:MAG: hypothetical protein WCT03_13285 [Candidatus Obscuribacterales bacterium]
MARVDVLELKSFQKISLNEVRYLNEMDFNKSHQARTLEAHKKSVSLKSSIKSKLKDLSRAFKSGLHNLLYETVPQCDTYSPD